MTNTCDVSVIIPTYNRKDSLFETLDSLAQQTLSVDRFEVIVVDDGSMDGTEEIAREFFPFTLRYFWQTNQGDAAARNLGAQQSQKDILVFIDDDILVEPNYLASLICEHETSQNRIVVGTEYLWVEDTNPLTHTSQAPKGADSNHTTVEYTFVDVCSNNMSLRREAYFTIGMMEGLDFPGSSIWCDVDFAYRAYKQGFEFCRSTRAICYHRDYVSQSLNNSKNRMREVACRAVVLFQKYPDLSSYLPMFRDKMPVTWGRDPISLIVRKLTRHMASSRLILKSMEYLVSILEQYYPFPFLLRPFSRWIIGGYIFRGYREGLRKYGQVERQIT